MKKNKIVHLRINDEDHEQMKKIAEKENRKIQDQYRHIISTYIAENENTITTFQETVS